MTQDHHSFGGMTPFEIFEPVGKLSVLGGQFSLHRLMIVSINVCITVRFNAIFEAIVGQSKAQTKMRFVIRTEGIIPGDHSNILLMRVILARTLGCLFDRWASIKNIKLI